RACKMNHFAAYGFWAPAVGDYTRHKVHERFDTPAYAELLKIVDPYSYRERLTLPKYIVNAAGDQYFPPDSSKFYFDDLKGPKYLRYVPNANHSLAPDQLKHLLRLNRLAQERLDPEVHRLFLQV